MDQLRPATISRGPWCWDQESLHLCCRGYHFVSGPIEQTPGCLGADTHKTSSLVHLIYKSFLCSGGQQTGTHAGYKCLSAILGGSGLSLPYESLCLQSCTLSQAAHPTHGPLLMSQRRSDTQESDHQMQGLRFSPVEYFPPLLSEVSHSGADVAPCFHITPSYFTDSSSNQAYTSPSSINGS